MNSYQSMINRIGNILIKKSLPYKDTIIIGDNSSGKSDVLKKIVELGDMGDVYLIDAVNRYFKVDQVVKTGEKIVYSSEITKYRIEEECFNRKDSFNYKGTPRAVEDLYFIYEDEFIQLVNEFLDIKFEITTNAVNWEVIINGEQMTLSSGYQAVLRIFLEVLYFKNTKGRGTIVIDELDEFLSTKNSAKIFGFLCNKFEQLNFIITTHSADLIANAQKANIIVLENDNFQVLDAGDFSSVSQVYCIFDSLFKSQKDKSQKEKIDDKLRELLNNKMSGVWEEKEKKTLEEIRKNDLTKTQKLIVTQIEGWNF